MPRLTEKQKRERARARGEVVFEPMNGATVKAMFNLIRNLFGNPHNLGSATKPFTDEYDWKQLQAKAEYWEYYELLKELAKTDERAYNKLYKDDPTIAYTFEQYKRDNPPSPAKIAELKAKYNPDIYLITDDERKYVTGQHSQARRLEDEAFRARSEAYFSQLSSAGPPAEAVALSSRSATQSAGGEPPRAQPRSTVSSRGRGRGGSAVGSGLTHEQFEGRKAEVDEELSAVSTDVLSVTPKRKTLGPLMSEAISAGAELPTLKALLKLTDEDYINLLEKREKIIDPKIKADYLRATGNVLLAYKLPGGPPGVKEKYIDELYPEAKGDAETIKMLKAKTQEVFARFQPLRKAKERDAKQAQADAEKAELKQRIAGAEPAIEKSINYLKESVEKDLERFGPESDFAKQGEIQRFKARDYIVKDVEPLQALLPKIQKAKERGDILGQIMLLNDYVRTRYPTTRPDQHHLTKDLPQLKTY